MLVHHRDEVLEAPGHSVDVVAEVDVRVEDVGAVRDVAAELGLPDLDQLLRALELFVHHS